MITLAIIGIFLCGAVCGACLMALFITRHQADIVVAAIRQVNADKRA